MGRLFVRSAFYDLFIAAQSLRAWARLSSTYTQARFSDALTELIARSTPHQYHTPARIWGTRKVTGLGISLSGTWGCRGCLLIDDGVGVIKIRHEGVVWRRTEQSVGTGPRLCFFKILFFILSFSTSVVVCLSDQCSTYAESCREGRREASMEDDDRRKRRVDSEQGNCRYTRLRVDLAWTCA